MTHTSRNQRSAGAKQARASEVFQQRQSSTRSGGSWSSFLDLSMLACTSIRPRMKAAANRSRYRTSSPTSSDPTQKLPTRQCSEDTTESLCVIVPDLTYQNDPHTIVSTRTSQRHCPSLLVPGSHRHQVSASVASTWLSTDDGTTTFPSIQTKPKPRLSWSSACSRVRQGRSENTSQRSSDRSLARTMPERRSQELFLGGKGQPMSVYDDDSASSSSASCSDEGDEDDTTEAMYWKTAVDAQSGRTYYFHTKTRETQWEKPLCCASPAERAATAAKEASTRNFFAAMEANIRLSITNQTIQNSEPNNKDDIFRKSFPEGPVSVPRQKPQALLIRTISTMEDSVLADLVQRVPSNRSVLTATTTRSTMSNNDDPSLARSISPSFSDRTEDSSSPIKQAHRPVQNAFLNRSAASLRGSITRLPIVSRGMMKLVPEEIHEDLSGSSYDMDPSWDDLPIQRGLERSSGTIRLNTDATTVTTTTTSTTATSSDHPSPRIEQRLPSVIRHEGISRENSLSLESLVPGSSRNVIRHSQWGSDSYRHPSFSQDANPSLVENSFSTRHRSQSSMDTMDVAFRTDSTRWGGTSFYSRTSIGDADETMLALAAISREMAASETRSELPPTPISTVDGLEGLNLCTFDDEDDCGEEPYMNFSATNGPVVVSEQHERPQIQRPQSLRVSPINNIPDAPILRPSMKRRNTCGTIYVGSTMAAPDKDATIKCVCGVFRAHILRSDDLDQTDVDNNNNNYSIFNDLESQRDSTRHNTELAAVQKEPPVPSLKEISQFYRDIFGRAQMEPDCIVISLIYVERLIKVTGGELRPRSRNWRSILFSCMVLSSKVWDDLSMWNADFSQTCPAGVHFTLQRVNELELALLSALQYQVKVPASEYAKYYFLLRSLLIKSGLGSDDLNTMNPLDVEGAKQLQQVTERYQSTANVRKSLLGRAKTTATSSPTTTTSNPSGNTTSSLRGSKVGLEQLVKW